MNENNNRQSIRLKNYDYSQSGHYFITICAQNRENMFGEIVNNSVGAGFSRPCIIKKIFQRNFYEHIIRNEEDYGRIRQYIQQNPLNWPARQCLSVAMAGGENDRNNPKNMI